MGATFRERQGDIFHSGSEVLVNPVNCVGVLGKGLAKAFKQRVPGLEHAYRADIAAGELRIGTVTSFASPSDGFTVANCPTKKHWRWVSRLEDIDALIVDHLEPLDEPTDRPHRRTMDRARLG